MFKALRFSMVPHSFLHNSLKTVGKKPQHKNRILIINAENDFLDQRWECAAPKHWSKYTTTNRNTITH